MSISLFGLFETSLTHPDQLANPFADVQLDSVFTSPSGRQINHFGFHDGDGESDEPGNVWKQRFMPDETGTWAYNLTFSDGSPGADGEFECIDDGRLPGPWKPNPENPHWILNARGDHFLPIAMHADCPYSPSDWRDAIEWCRAFQYNTLITSTMNTWAWASEWPNTTAFETADESSKVVDYTRYNLRMWRSWDDLLRIAGSQEVYIGPFNGPDGFYGGRRGKYPPEEIAYEPGLREGPNTDLNRQLIHYLIARQGAYWNLAYWSLCSTEMYAEVEEESEGVRYGEYFASLAPFGRMITAQDCEQWHGVERRWLSAMNFPAERKLNAVQTGVGVIGDPEAESFIDDPSYQEAGPNNAVALHSYSGFPIITTEGLWEGQGRAQKPLRIIWGFYCAAAHPMWADWSYEDPENHNYGSIGHGWVPVRPLDEPFFRSDLLGADCVGHRELRIAADAISTLEYWKMNPANELVAGSDEAYCLAEPGRQYLVYTPHGGSISLDTISSVPRPSAGRPWNLMFAPGLYRGRKNGMPWV